MSKNKITIVDSLYHMGFPQGTRKEYMLQPTIVQTLHSLSMSSTNEMILNFNDKKDKRQDWSKESYWNDVVFSISTLFNNTNPLCDFVFNQSQFSPTFFRHVYVNGPTSWTYPRLPILEKNDKNSFKWNGTFGEIQLLNCPFSNVHFNYNNVKKIIRTIPIKIKENRVLSSLEIKCSSKEALSADPTKSSNFASLCFRWLNAESLKEIVIKDFKSIKFEDLMSYNGHLQLPNLTKLDITDCQFIHFDSDYLFEKFDDILLSNESFKSAEKIDSEISNFVNKFKKIINPNLKIELNPESYIFCDLLGNHSSTIHENWFADSTKIKIKDLFGPIVNNKITITPLDILNKYYLSKQAKLEKKLNSRKKVMNDFLSKLADPTKDNSKVISK